ncbi:uncharacterized protein LOC143898565 [Temnothorax americanus]|uniref:uncharacterized protein LOC143898565 n=1 Tax=Temnothorax americanus TaxID=1964332 RepID=UPI0040675F9C
MNNDVFVTKADKGQITVIMDKSDYINRMTELLNDTSTYKKLKKDPIKQVTSKLNQLVTKSWLDNDIIDDQDYRRLRCTNGNLPRCYGLPKESIPKPRSHIKDSWSFVRRIVNSNIDTKEILISLDVTALFTNIPKDLVCEGVRKRWHHISQYTKLNLAQFLYAIELILQSTSFGFDGQFYEQIFGSPMGSPLSLILADIVMENLETSLEEHEIKFQRLMKRLEEANLTLQPDKCKFLKKEVAYLGHVITENGVRLEPKKDITENS